MDSISAAVSSMFTPAAVKQGTGVSLERKLLTQQGDLMTTLLGGLPNTSGLGQLLDVRV